MAALGTNFDASRVAPMEQGYSIWEGRVPMTITKTEIKATSANDGNNMLVLTVKALDAPFVGQENVIRLNLYNKSAQAVDIAQRELSSICHVTGKMNVTDSDQLMGVPFIGVWAKGTRVLTDQQTGAQRNVETCNCKDYTLIDGRTIKEAMAGQAASSPYIPGQSGHAAPAPAQPQGGFGQAPQPQPQAGAQPGFAPPPGAAQPQPAPSGGFASPGSATAPNGFGAPQGQGMPTAGSGFSPPAQQPQPGFAPPGQAPQPQQGGFGAQPQPGAGPWGPQAR